MSKFSIKEKYLIFKVRQNKDAGAYGELYDYYVDRIYRFIFFKVSAKEVAEDLTSEVFLKTWEYIKTTNKKIDNLNALFYRVARNCVIDHYRKKNYDNKMSDEDQMELIQDKRDMVEEVSIKIEIENIEKLLDKLKDIHKEVIVLKYVENYSIGEIAEIINQSRGNVRVLLHRALKALKELAGEN